MRATTAGNKEQAGMRHLPYCTQPLNSKPAQLPTGWTRMTVPVLEAVASSCPSSSHAITV